MNDLLLALQTGSVSLWIFIPAAILLGVLHGLEPGHSKTMMAAFIVAIRGTIGQAVLLGLSAAISHSLIIWILAAAALHYGNQLNAETAEPYLQLGSAVVIFRTGNLDVLSHPAGNCTRRISTATTTTIMRTANCFVLDFPDMANWS